MCSQTSTTASAHIIMHAGSVHLLAMQQNIQLERQPLRCTPTTQEAQLLGRAATVGYARRSPPEPCWVIRASAGRRHPLPPCWRHLPDPLPWPQRVPGPHVHHPAGGRRKGRCGRRAERWEAGGQQSSQKQAFPGSIEQLGRHSTAGAAGTRCLALGSGGAVARVWVLHGGMAPRPGRPGERTCACGSALPSELIPYPTAPYHTPSNTPEPTPPQACTPAADHATASSPQAKQRLSTSYSRPPTCVPLPLLVRAPRHC